MVKEEVNWDFPPKPNISIPLRDWLHNSVVPTHKYCGKLEIRSYVLRTWFEMHPNFTMSDSEELNIGDFDPSTYQHILPEGAHDYDDYDSEYEKEHRELGFTDKQVEAEVAKLDPEDKKFYEEYHDFLDAYYGQHGRIIEMSVP